MLNHRDLPKPQRTASEIQERRRQVRGLLLIALVILILSILRAGVHRVFTQGWWRLW